jgi:site-specific recombinase XerD
LSPRPAHAASYRFLEFFTANICNAHTRRAYARAATEFFDWRAAKGVTKLAEIGSIHVATYIEGLSRAGSAPTAKLRLAALRHLFGRGERPPQFERRARLGFRNHFAQLS